MLRRFIKFLWWWWVCGYRAILSWAVFAAHDAVRSRVVTRGKISRCPAKIVRDSRYWVIANVAAAKSIRFINRQRQALGITWPDDGSPSSKPSAVSIMSLSTEIRLMIWGYAFENYSENQAMLLAACSFPGETLQRVNFPDTYHIRRRWTNPMLRVNFETQEFAKSRYERRHIKRRYSRTDTRWQQLLFLRD